MAIASAEYPTWCECGCGAEINKSRRQILALRHSGLTYARCDRVLGYGLGYSKSMISRPARFVKGHSARVAIPAIRPCESCGADVIATTTQRVVICRGRNSRNPRCTGSRLWVDGWDANVENQRVAAKEWRARTAELTGARASISERERLADQAVVRQIARDAWRDDAPRRAAVRREVHRLLLEANALERAERLAVRMAQHRQTKARRVNPALAAIADPLAEGDDQSRELARLIYEQICEDTSHEEGDGHRRAFGLPGWLTEDDDAGAIAMGYGPR